MRKAGLVIIGTAFALAACGEPSLRDLRSQGEGPDEFMIAPVLPLQEPENFTDLPPPAPGNANRTDQQPRADAIVALGGSAGSAAAPVPSADSGIVSYASRNGVDPAIRAKLAEDDARFRQRQARFSQIRIFREDRYDEAYRRDALNPFATAERFRRAGIPVPSAPPARGQ